MGKLNHMNATPPTKLARLETLLFSYGEPLEIKKIAKLLGLENEECETAVAELEKLLTEGSSRGLMLARTKNQVQLLTKPEHHKVAQKILEEEFREELSPAALEALSLVAYLGPIQRSLIDYIRGVNSSFTLRSLLVRGLIGRTANPEKGNVYDYTVSFEFLKHMGLAKVEELPEYERYKNILKEFQIERTD